MKNLDSLLSFTRLLHQFQAIKRKILIPETDRYENDAEHSYQLAMTAWYLISANSLNLNLEKVLKYALLHDLVEVYAGDTYAYASEEEKTSKHDREQKALEQLKREFPEFEDLSEIIQAYEQKDSPESRFVYALDKLLPMMNTYLDQGRTWKRQHISLEEIVAYKKPKMQLSLPVKAYYDTLLEILRKHRSDFFNE